MTENTFGALLGQMIYTKRKALGLTQMQLSEDAFGTPGKTRRICELEGGQVANPHPKTIDPIIVTLGITEKEIEQCAEKSVINQNLSLEVAYSEAGELLDKLAEQYDNSIPDASLVELGEFLTEKAKEYTVLKEKICDLERSDQEMTLLTEAAMSALAKGDYILVDDLLRQAEETELRSQTLEQVGKQANLRVLRGDTHFLAGNLTECFKMYKGAALYFEAFDAEAMLATFQNLAGVVYEASRRSLAPTYWVAEKLLEEALIRCSVEENPATAGAIHYRLSLILRNQHAHEQAEKKELLLKRAVDHARNGIIALSKTEQGFDLASSRISLGNCLSDLAYLKKDAAIGLQAESVFEEAKKSISANKDLDLLMGHACGGLATAIMRTFAIDSTPSRETETYYRAVSEYEGALAAAGRSNDQEIWGAAQTNLAYLYFEKAKKDKTSDDEAQFLRVRSISSFLAAIETFPEVRFPVPFAEAHFGLAEVLFEHGLRAEDHLYELYFMRALQSYTQAAEIHTEESHPQRWAHIQCRLGSVLGNHARRAEPDVALQDLENAIHYFEEGKRVFELCNYIEGVNSCERNIDLLNKEKDRLG